MTDKEKIHQILSSLWKNDDSVGKMCYNQALQDVQTAIDLQEEPVSEKKCMFTNDNYTDEDRMILCEDCKEKCEYSKKEEHVSEELEEAAKEWLRPQLDKSYANYGEVKMMELTHFDGYAMLDAIEFGAKWQKTKDESTTENLGEYINELSKQFPEVSFAKLSRIAVRVAKWQKQQDQSVIELAEDHAMLAGMEKMKEEMMAKAINTKASLIMSVPSICISLPLGVNVGDKVKVIVIKEN